MDRREEVEAKLRDDKALPAGPAVMARLSEICHDPRASARDLGKVIQLDPALVTRVLKQVNSAFYGLSATIKTVTHAVVILGFEEIKHIALSVPVANLYEEHFGDAGLDVQALWDRTLADACLARALSYHIKHDVPEQVFVSGILANCGMVIMNGILGEDYSEVVNRCGDPEFLPEVETQELGISHVDVGVRLARKWRFPTDLVDALAHHHEPIRDDGVEREAGLIYTAGLARRQREDILAATEALAGDEEEVPDPYPAVCAQIPAPILEAFNLTPEALAQAYEKSLVELDDARKSLTEE